MNPVEVVTLRFPAGLRGELMELARSEGNSMNSLVVGELRKAIKRSKAPSSPKPTHSGER